MIKQAITPKSLASLYEELARELPRNASAQEILGGMSKKIRDKYRKDVAISTAVLGTLGGGALAAGLLGARLPDPFAGQQLQNNTASDGNNSTSTKPGTQK